MVRNYRDNHVTWLPGSIMKKLGQVTFVVILDNGSQRKCHIDQIRRREASYTSERKVNDQGTDVKSEDSDSSDVEMAVITDSKATIQDSIINDNSSPLNEEIDNDHNVDEVTNTDSTSSSSSRYSKRNRKPPDRFT